MKGPTEQVLGFVSGEFPRPAAGVVQEAERLLLDSIGVGIAALESD